jgi:hypothetical protein
MEVDVVVGVQVTNLMIRLGRLQFRMLPPRLLLLWFRLIALPGSSRTNVKVHKVSNTVRMEITIRTTIGSRTSDRDIKGSSAKVTSQQTLQVMRLHLVMFFQFRLLVVSRQLLQFLWLFQNRP